MGCFSDLISLFYPQLCYACYNSLTQNERGICVYCRVCLPVTNFHLEDNNHLKQKFYGRLQLEDAVALFYFVKHSYVQNLLHNLKYRKHREISSILGKWLIGECIKVGKFTDVDCVIPIPLYKTKYKKRGYNQVEGFAMEIAKKLSIKLVLESLVKLSATRTQTRKSRFSRWENVQTVFKLKDGKVFENKHVLLVDDIITTGATIEACCIQFQDIKGVKISIACMAMAQF